MSTAWYKPSAVPKLLKAFSASSYPSRSIEVWNTTCIVTNFGKSKASACSVLINPSNPSLTGVKKFPYFPRGGPEPKEQPKKYEHHIMGYVSQWGGMDLGTGMLFAANVVDGLVHQLGGWKLALWLKLLPKIDGKDKCPVGYSVSSSPGGEDLSAQYNEIIHTVPPFFKYHDDPDLYLAKSYQSSLNLAFSRLNVAQNYQHRVAVPLLGAGARGFPLDVAIQIAANESIQWRNQQPNNIVEANPDIPQKAEHVLAFGIPDMKIAEQLISAIEQLEENET